MKKTIRWQAIYETVIEVPEGADAGLEAAMIDINVPGSEYQSDTWEVLEIK